MEINVRCYSIKLKKTKKNSYLGMFLAIVGPTNLADLNKLALLVFLPDKSILPLMKDLVVVRLGYANKLAVLHNCCHHLSKILNLP